MILETTDFQRLTQKTYGNVPQNIDQVIRQGFVEVARNRLLNMNFWFKFFSPTFHYGFLITSYYDAIFLPR